MNSELTEKLIVFVADALEKNVPEDQIILALAMDKNESTVLYAELDLELVFIAGNVLYQDRKNAPLKKTLIRRLP